MLHQNANPSFHKIKSFTRQKKITYMGFPTPSLPVSKAGGHTTLKYALHKRSGGVPVDHIIVAVLVKCIIKTKVLVFQILRHVHFGLGLADLNQICQK